MSSNGLARRLARLEQGTDETQPVRITIRTRDEATPVDPEAFAFTITIDRADAPDEADAPATEHDA